MEIKKLQWRGATVGCFLNTASIFTVIVLEKDFINIIEHAIISIARLKKKNNGEKMKVNFEEAVYCMILLNYCLYGTFCILLNIWHRINESMNEILGCLLFSKKKKGKLFLAVKSCL